MIWRNSPAELQFYTLGADDPCFCEFLLEPNDLTVQGTLASPPTSSSTLVVRAYTPDGLTLLADVTTSVDYYLATWGSISYFVARLRSFPPELCANPCFVLRFTVETGSTTLFDKYTEMYCIDSCCLEPKDVTITGTGVSQGPEPTPSAGAPGTEPGSRYCRPLLTLEVEFDCYDRFRGDVWTTPSNILKTNLDRSADDVFTFRKRLNLRGTIRRLPRDIERSISKNCRVQRVESFRVFELQSFEEFPGWKWDELEDMLHAPRIFVNGREYRFPGGKVFELTRAKQCKDFARIKLPLEECTRSQIFGCAPDCKPPSGRYFGLRRLPPSGSAYYDEGGRYIGETKESLLNWFRVQNGVTEVEEMTGAATLPHELLFRVAGSRYVATSFYSGSRLRSARVFGKALDLPSSDTLNEDVLGYPPGFVVCNTPPLATPTVEDLSCDTPALAAVVVEEICKTPALGPVIVEENFRY